MSSKTFKRRRWITYNWVSSFSIKKGTDRCFSEKKTLSFLFGIYIQPTQIVFCFLLTLTKHCSIFQSLLFILLFFQIIPTCAGILLGVMEKSVTLMSIFVTICLTTFTRPVCSFLMLIICPKGLFSVSKAAFTRTKYWNVQGRIKQNLIKFQSAASNLILENFILLLGKSRSRLPCMNKD